MTFDNPLDFWVTTFLNQFARGSWAFDQMVAFLAGSHLLKGGVLMALLWWVWFRREDGLASTRNRAHIVATLASCVVALAICRLLLYVLPHRQRPLHDEQLALVLPHGVARTVLDGFSSFPSDHATLFFALATGFFFISRRLGFLALAYTVFAIALPRIYLGLHYTSDIVAGGLIGIIITMAGNKLLTDNRAVQYVTGLSVTSPQFVYPVLFLVTYQVADLFANSKAIVSGMGKLFAGF